VRPGWFDFNEPDQQKLVMLQGDRRQAGDPSDCAVAKHQIAETLLQSGRKLYRTPAPCITSKCVNPCRQRNGLLMHLYCFLSAGDITDSRRAAVYSLQRTAPPSSLISVADRGFPNLLQVAKAISHRCRLL
jgi:hypothetical protein